MTFQPGLLAVEAGVDGVESGVEISAQFRKPGLHLGGEAFQKSNDLRVVACPSPTPLPQVSFERYNVAPDFSTQTCVAAGRELLELHDLRRIPRRKLRRLGSRAWPCSTGDISILPIT